MKNEEIKYYFYYAEFFSGVIKSAVQGNIITSHQGETTIAVWNRMYKELVQQAARFGLNGVTITQFYRVY